MFVIAATMIMTMLVIAATYDNDSVRDSCYDDNDNYAACLELMIIVHVCDDYFFQFQQQRGMAVSERRMRIQFFFIISITCLNRYLKNNISK